MSWVLLVGIAWALLALPAALLLGRTLCAADRRELAVYAVPVPAVLSTESFFAAFSASPSRLLTAGRHWPPPESSRLTQSPLSAPCELNGCAPVRMASNPSLGGRPYSNASDTP